MKAAETNVLKLLQGSKVFVIPSFQRRYSWRAKEWELLWADLLREYNANHPTDSQSLDGHFLGSIVLHPAAGAASTLMKHLVIDGQQRLTTILILLAAIRDVRAELEGVDPSQYDTQYLTNPYDKEYPDRLMPTRLDREAYAKTIRGGEPAEGIGQGYEYFAKRIRDAAKTDGIELEKLASTLLLHMLLVEINTTPGDSVNNIFNTLNSKGLPLSPSDLVRNELLLHVGDRKAEEAYDKYWLPMERALVHQTKTKIVDREFVTFLWSREVAQNATTSRQDLFARFETRLRKELSGLKSSEREARALELFREMYDDHKLFLVLRDPLGANVDDSRIGPDLRQALDRLRRWGSEPTTPIALWVLKETASGRIDESEAALTIQTLLSFLIRRTLGGIPTNQLNRLLTPVAFDLNKRTGTSVVSELQRILTRQGYYWQTDNDVIATVESLPVYATAPRNVRFLLREAEELLPGMERADLSTAQIDHIVPQTLSDAWTAYFVAADVELDEVNSLVHTLGNLTLTDNNQSMGNATFDEKKHEYFADSALRLNRELAELDEFLPGTIRGRTRQLAELVLARYPGPPSDSSTSEADPDLTGASVDDRLEAALQAMPEGAWTTEDDLVTFLGAQRDETRSAVNRLSPVLARLVRNPDRGLPEWLDAELRTRVASQATHDDELGERQDENSLRRLSAAVESADELEDVVVDDESDQ